jgi:HAE1 family hydrophobic/amphiphilic exporter-1
LRRRGNGSGIVLLKDVGRAELGAESYSTSLRYGDRTFSSATRSESACSSSRTPTRWTWTSAARRCSPSCRSRSRRASQGFIAVDTTTVVSDSIREVEKTLAEAIVIVIVVIFLFLQDWRATLIPAITIPVSLIGTFAFIKLFGFSINSLTLFGITLATGLVVDDAIVVIENVQRHLEGMVIMGRGLRPRPAQGDHRSPWPRSPAR